MPAENKFKPALSGIRTILMSIIITTMLNMGFTWMLTSTYGLDKSMSLPAILLGSVAVATAYTLFWQIKNRFVTLIPFFVIPAAVVAIIWFDLWDTQHAFDNVIHELKENTFRNIPGTYLKTLRGTYSLTLLFFLLETIPSLFTTFFIVKRKGFIPAIIFYLPYFICSVGLVFMFPKQYSFELSLFGMALLVLLFVFRKKERKEAENKTLLLSVPLMAMLLVLGIIFPMDKYDKDKLAHKTITNVRMLVMKSPLKSNKQVMNAINKAEGNPITSGVVQDFAQQFAPVTAGDTNLLGVGNFDPPLYTVCTILKTRNDNYLNSSLSQDIPASGSNYIYLKGSSKDVYSDNMWTDSNLYLIDSDRQTDYDYACAQYYIDISYFSTPEVALVPYYTDMLAGTDVSTTNINYTVDANNGSGVIINSNQGEQDSSKINSHNKVEKLAGSNQLYDSYLSSPLPVKTSGYYSDSYLNDYVYSTTLEVPEETRQSLINSGMLPDWYMQVLNGEIELSTADKVRAVTNFVRNIHPYDKFTDYPPEDVDFVTWFLTDADTGFCVHYATTTVILLRMIGVPARYVDGYMVSGLSNEIDHNVYSTDAHAWFEFFLPDFGWIMGDSTPGNQRVASDFDIDALARYYPEYATEYEFQIDGSFSQIDQADPNATNTPTPVEQEDPSKPKQQPEVTKQVEQESTTKSVSVMKILTPVLISLCVIVPLVLIRLVYVRYWRSQFAIAEINTRTRAYYHYFKFISKFVSGRPAKRVTYIAEKAAFSNEMISDKELKQLIDISKRSSETLVKKAPWYSRLLYRIFSVKVK